MLPVKLNREKGVILLDQAVVSGSTLLTQLLVAGKLGISHYGVFSAIIMAQLFLLSLQQAGLTGMYQATYGRLSGAASKVYLSGIWTTELAFLAIVSIGGLAGMGVYPVVSVSEYFAALSGTVLYLLQDFVRRVLLTHGQTTKALLADVLNNGLQLAGLFYFYLYGDNSLQPVLWIYALSFIPSVFSGLLWIRPSVSLAHLRDSYRSYKSETGWMTAAALLQWFSGNAYIIAAGWWLGAPVLGAVRLGQYIFGLLNVLLQAVENYLLPRAGALASEPARVIHYLKNAQKKLLLSLGSVILLVAATSSPVMKWLGYTAHDSVRTVIGGMSLVYLFVIAGYPIRIALRTLGMNRLFFSGYVLNAVFGFSTAYFFIHQWQLGGVLAGLLLSQILLLIYWTGSIRHQLKVSWR